jgi:AraC-like DNA-binding protein
MIFMPNLSQSSGETSVPLLDVLRLKLISGIECEGMNRVTIARGAARELVLPAGVQVSRKKMQSRRIAVRGPRAYGNASLATARWPQDFQEALRVPMLVCVVGGHADLQLGNYVLHGDEGEVIFIPPGVPHPYGPRSHLEGKQRKSGFCDLLWLSPRGRKMHCWICHSRGETHHGPQPGENVFALNAQLADFMDVLQHEALERKIGYEKIFESVLRALLLTLERELQEGRFLQLSGGVEESAPLLENDDPILAAQQYIGAHLGDALTLDKVARQVHMSRAQFTRRFKSETGITFLQFLSAARLREAQTFLRETDWSVPHISSFIGFASPSHFHRFFREHTGLTPLEFRRSRQNPTAEE